MDYIFAFGTVVSVAYLSRNTDLHKGDLNRIFTLLRSFDHCHAIFDKCCNDTIESSLV